MAVAGREGTLLVDGARLDGGYSLLVIRLFLFPLRWRPSTLDMSNKSRAERVASRRCANQVSFERLLPTRLPGLTGARSWPSGFRRVPSVPARCCGLSSNMAHVPLEAPLRCVFHYFSLAQWCCSLCGSTSSHCGGERLVKPGAGGWTWSLGVDTEQECGEEERYSLLSQSICCKHFHHHFKSATSPFCDLDRVARGALSASCVQEISQTGPQDKGRRV